MATKTKKAEEKEKKSATMTKEQARQFLIAHGYCERHGIKLKKEIRNGGYGEMHHYCPRCRNEQETEEARQVQEAIQVLGI